MHKKILAVLILLIPVLTIAQVTTNSPYSQFGLGMWKEPIDGISLGRGGARIGLNDSTYANIHNPASLPYLGKGQPLFSFDLSTRFSNFESASGKSSDHLVYLNSIQIAIPFAKRFALALGMKPVISRGYDFKTYEVIAGDSLRHSYMGEGGVQQVYFNFSGAILKNEKNYLALGADLGYNFGNTANSKRSDWINSSSYFNGLYNVNDRIRGFSLNTGLSYQYTISKYSSFSIGVTYAMPTYWKTTSLESLVRYTGDYDVSPANIDTIFSTGELGGKVLIPQRIGFGVGYEIRAREDSLKSRLLMYRVRILADIEMMSWSQYKKEVNGIPVNETYSDAMYARFGIEYTPHHKFLDKSPSIKYLSRMTYRLGANYGQIPGGDTRLTDFGMTFGLGFPIPFNRSVSSLNIGMKIGQQGEIGPTSIRERYIGVNFGIILSPGFNDKWFRKFKYD